MELGFKPVSQLCTATYLYTAIIYRSVCGLSAPLYSTICCWIVYWSEKKLNVTTSIRYHIIEVLYVHHIEAYGGPTDWSVEPQGLDVSPWSLKNTWLTQEGVPGLSGLEEVGTKGFLPSLAPLSPTLCLFRAMQDFRLPLPAWYPLETLCPSLWYNCIWYKFWISLCKELLLLVVEWCGAAEFSGILRIISCFSIPWSP